MDPTGMVVLLFFGAIVFARLFRIVVPPNYAHVVIVRNQMRVYTSLRNINDTGNAVYYHVPQWIPYFGMFVVKIPLENLEIQVPDYQTFAKNNARFKCTVSLYLRITDVIKAAQRFPTGEVDAFIARVRELAIAAIRNTTTLFDADEVIAKKKDIADGIQHALSEDLLEWGVTILNAAVVDIDDADDTTVITDISAKKEAEINADSRKTVAQRMRDAEKVEYETKQDAETRKWEMEEAIRVREQQQQQKVAAEEQKAAEEQMKVVRVKEVRQAEINKLSAIEAAEARKREKILESEAEAEFTRKTGTADADIVKLKGESEAHAILKRGEARGHAKEAEAEGLNKMNQAGERFREIEKEEKIGLEMARALQTAELKFISTAEIKNLTDLFSANGGANVGAFLDTLKKADTETYNRIMGLMETALTGGAHSLPTPGKKKKKIADEQ